jgi:hypothetical protein
MPGWLPDDVWLLQKLEREMRKGQWGTGGSKGWGGKGWGKGKPKVVPPRGKKVVDPDKSWKQRLSEAYQKKHKTVPTKDMFEYTCEQLDDSWYCALSSSAFGSTIHESPDLEPSKKLAEESAAKVALEAEFHEIFATIPDSAKNKSIAEKASQVQVKPEQGQKRTGAFFAKGTADNSPKSKLSIACARVSGKSHMAKEDIVYSVETVDGMFMASVTLSAFDGATVHGEPVDATTMKRKDAENSAAEAALAKYEEEIKEAEIVQQARKKIKDKEWAEKKTSFEASKTSEGP